MRTDDMSIDYGDLENHMALEEPATRREPDPDETYDRHAQELADREADRRRQNAPKLASDLGAAIRQISTSGVFGQAELIDLLKRAREHVNAEVPAVLREQAG